MITDSNSPVSGSGMPNHSVGDLLSTIAISGLSRVRTELLPLTIVQALAPHPVLMHRQFAGHCYLGDLAATAHSKMKEPTPPLWLTAHRNLRRFHQQKAKYRVALFGDVPQPTPIAAGLFFGNQPHVAGNLLPTTKAFGSSNHQLESQGGQWPHTGVRHQSARHRTFLDFAFQS